jgi:capsular polysaccharide transport system permease protein
VQQAPQKPAEASPDTGETAKETAGKTGQPSVTGLPPRPASVARPEPRKVPDKPPVSVPVSVSVAEPVANLRSVPATPKTPAVAPPVVTPIAPVTTSPIIAPAVAPARLRGRHWMLALSFILLVLAPIGGTGWYLYQRAADQYASTVAFSVRREDTTSALDLLGGITALSGSSSSDTDILYEFLQSQKLVADMDAALDLRALWAKPENDPYFAFDPKGSIEDLVAYWGRMVQIYYDSGSGLIEIRVLAFDPDDATRIADALFTQSSQMINDLSAIAREDSIRYAREELATAMDRLKVAREVVTEFRNLHQMVDPSMDMQVQTGLLATLESQLAAALIEVDLLGDSSGSADPRMVQAQRRVEVIEARIAAERDKMGMGTGESGGPEAFASLVSEYERLGVEREFAERTYVAALAAYDGALAEARRKSRYLAAHILPTTAETSRFPERGTLLALLGGFLFLAWTILSLVAYALKDRR